MSMFAGGDGGFLCECFVIVLVLFILLVIVGSNEF